MIISMPMCSARNWRGEMVGFNGPVEVDDSDKDAVAWAKAWLGQGATLVEDVKTKAEPPKFEPDPPPVQEPETVPETDYRTAEELRAELRQRGLPTYGSKQDMLDRLAEPGE